MNMAPMPKPIVLTIEWEFIPGLPPTFDVVFPIWLDVRGNCLNESSGAKDTDLIFTGKSATGWTSPHTGEVILMVPHIHDGNTNQTVFLDGKAVCETIPKYGETAEFVSHNEAGGGHGHDHGTDEHTYHVSSITQCSNAVKVVPGSNFKLESTYDLKKHTPMKEHDGELEPTMAIAFLHLARSQAEAIEAIKAMKGGDLEAWREQLRRLRSDE
jgi:hypothetical protein